MNNVIDVFDDKTYPSNITELANSSRDLESFINNVYEMNNFSQLTILVKHVTRIYNVENIKQLGLMTPSNTNSMNDVVINRYLKEMMFEPLKKIVTKQEMKLLKEKYTGLIKKNIEQNYEELKGFFDKYGNIYYSLAEDNEILNSSAYKEVFMNYGGELIKDITDKLDKSKIQEINNIGTPYLISFKLRLIDSEPSFVRNVLELMFKKINDFEKIDVFTEGRTLKNVDPKDIISINEIKVSQND